MGDITLYTRERCGAGLTTTDVCRVKGADRLQVISEGQIRRYPIKGGGPVETNYMEIGPDTGRADLLLQTADREIDLAKCKWAAAVLVSGWNDETTVYWIKAGICPDFADLSSGREAHAKIEERCCPDEYELPPQIT
jgi:hypothetical protein